MKNIITVFCAKPGGWTELPDLVPDYVLVEGEWFRYSMIFLPFIEVILVRSKLKDCLSTFIKRIKGFAGDGPSTQGNPFAFFKINGIKGRAETCPVTGGSPEIMKPGRLQRVVSLAG